MYKIFFSSESIDDLKEIEQYIQDELCSEQSAQNTVAKILKKIKMLSDFPESGSSLSNIIGFNTDYRYLVCGNFIAFYRIENKNVLIVRVLYCRRNFMQILFGDIS